MSPNLETALSDCDRASIRLWHESPDRIKFRGPGGAPDSLRGAVANHRAELLELLRTHPRPDPASLLYVSPKLDTIRASAEAAGWTFGVWFEGRPYYRLTPAILSHFHRKAESLYPTLDRPTIQEIAANLSPLWEWVERYYRPDQIERALRRPQPLPTVQRGQWFQSADAE